MKSALVQYSNRIEGFEEMDFDARRAAVERSEFLSSKHHTKATLKALFRVKPRPDAVSEYSFKNTYGKSINCYRLDQCIPMRPCNASPRTKKQIKATQALIHTNQVNSQANQAALRAKAMVESDVCVIDTETTSLTGVVIQIAVVSLKSNQLIYESFVRTDQEISLDAFETHGITCNDLVAAPDFVTVAKDIGKLLAGRRWTAFNRSFDQSVMQNSLGGLSAQSESNLSWIGEGADCVMRDIAAGFYGATNRHGTISLADSLSMSGLKFIGQAHDARADSLSTANLVRFIADQSVE